MISFPNAKINLGLHITEKRPDGFHNIETVFYPTGWCDVLELIENRTGARAFNLHLSGLPIAGDLHDNLLYKAYQLISRSHLLPNIDVYLHKVIPMGAGLGGGSADAAFFINLLDQAFELGLTEDFRIEIARQLGSDCAFFIKNKPLYAREKGDVFEPVNINLAGYYLAIVYANVHSNTKEAYSLVKPMASTPLKNLIEQTPVKDWRSVLKNDFEISIFSKYPQVQALRDSLYNNGALYACMSGSGSAVFGLFDKEPVLSEWADYPHWVGLLS
ncbi:MAG: 4-(cytidine 5'-diphospho)-2-C-methyl-D-erythritol kinase [Bacteroidetes bacterium]|nr:4-(cytidine 5'-diphospho)-2-C-methyl-D-erythritol kinase [Bacteroidota bacterium]